jgi:Sulfotransferase family
VIHLDDLASPAFSDTARGVLSQIGSAAGQIHLRSGAVLDAARAHTGLSDFGDEDFHEPLDVLCRALVEQAELSDAGQVLGFEMLKRLAGNRLRLEELIHRHPEIVDVEICRPLFIVGVPRSGTTHLLNLIASDPGMRSMRYWESLEPVPRSMRRGSEVEVSARLAVAVEACALMDTVIPHLRAMHEMTPEHVHEDAELLGMTFSTMLFEFFAAPLPAYRDWLRSHDQTFAYRYLKRALQAMQWLRGGTRWVLKTPSHLEHLRRLTSVFPDGRFVFTHRDPVPICTSYATMATYAARMTVRKIDPAWFGAYWSDRIIGLLQGCVDDRDCVPVDQSLDIRFDEFMADIPGAVRRVYTMAGLPHTAEVEAAVRGYLDGHSRDRHGRVDYRADVFGLENTELRERLRLYTDRFGVRLEV